MTQSRVSPSCFRPITKRRKNVEKKNIESLLIKSFTTQTSEEEEQIINVWLAESAKNKRLFESYKRMWSQSQSLVLPGIIDVESALLKSKEEIPQFKQKRHWLAYWKQVAAILVLSICISSIYNYLGNKYLNAELAIYQEVKAAYGTQTHLQLADGTSVWLNAGSKLSFPTSFKNLDERKVKLTGEGFFKVTKNARQPFIVSTSQLDVKVLGTSFNVNAYENENNITVALEEGKISLLQQKNGKEKEVLTLSPLEIANYDIKNNKIIQSTATDLKQYTAWKDGLIVFADDPIEKVISRLENWYNVTIEVSDPKILQYHITGTFDDNSLDQVLYFLSLMSPIKYQFINNDPNEKNDLKQKIILSEKTI